LVRQLKRELLMDLDLNKEFVRSYEIAARRLEAIFKEKVDPKKLDEFNRLLKEEVKDFLD